MRIIVITVLYVPSSIINIDEKRWYFLRKGVGIKVRREQRRRRNLRTTAIPPKCLTYIRPVTHAWTCMDRAYRSAFSPSTGTTLHVNGTLH
jgi:hypothetical protein